MVSEDNSSFQIKTVPISSVNESIIPEGATLIYESEIAQIINAIRENDAAEEAERKATEERIAKLEKQAEEALCNLKL